MKRTPDGNRMHWGRIRKGALASGGVLSNFLQKTIVLTPERLQLSLRKAGEGEGKTVEVTPGFEDAPARWIEIFDRLPSVQDRYEIPGGEELTHVVVTPEVQTVLREIKRMPGRRVSGSRAEAFVRNPFALLGPDAETVVSAEAFEAEREKAGLSFERFTPFVERDEQGTLSRVGLRVEEADGESISTTELDLASPDSSGSIHQETWRTHRPGSAVLLLGGVRTRDSWRDGAAPCDLEAGTRRVECSQSSFSGRRSSICRITPSASRASARKSSTARHLSRASRTTPAGYRKTFCLVSISCRRVPHNRLPFR
jgi:hypothetical protein